MMPMRSVARAFCSRGTFVPSFTLAPVTTHLGPQLYAFSLQHPLLATGKSPLEVYEAKLCGHASVGSRVMLRHEMTADELVRISDAPEAATNAFSHAYDIVSHREFDDTYTLSFMEYMAGLSAEKLIKDVSASKLRGGVHTRMLKMPALSAKELADHVRVMWPEPLERRDIEILMGGVAVREGSVPLASMLDGEVGFRVHGELVRCAASKHFDKFAAKADENWMRDHLNVLMAIAALSIPVVALKMYNDQREKQKLEVLYAEQASDRWQEMSSEEKAENRRQIAKIEAPRRRR